MPDFLKTGCKLLSLYVTKALKKPMSHARRFRFILIIYLPMSLKSRLATRPMTCAHCLSHETHGRGTLTVGGPGSLNLLNPLLLRHCSAPVEINSTRGSIYFDAS